MGYVMDWKEVKQAQSLDELKKVKLWLFQENIRIQNEQAKLDEMKDKFIQEKTSYQKDIDALNRKLVLEQKRLREENQFFEKKMAILQDGFRRLEADRNKFESQKRDFEAGKRLEQQYSSQDIYCGDMEGFVRLLFRNANTSLTLRKRYRDLMKIFHPDNSGGDEELVQLINKEFARRKDAF